MSSKEQKLWEKLAQTGKKAGRKIAFGAACLWYVAIDPKTPPHIKATALGPLAYLVNPLDAIPDLTPVVGFSDDAAVIAGALALLAVRIRAHHKNKARELIEEWFGPEPTSRK
jgi:uncharacterized membrane protein YkvA (DUF1232 family)